MKDSIWLIQTEGKHYPPLSEDKHVHTLIVGAGLSGLTTAYYLSNITSNVLIVEADEIGYGASGRNTGKVTSQHGFQYKKLIETHGIEKARQYYIAQEEAIDSIEAIIQEHDIDCSWSRQNAMLFTQEETKKAQIQEEYQACLDLGIPCTYIDQYDAPFPFVAGIRFENQGSYDPYRYLLGLSNRLDAQGIAIYEHSHAKHIQKDGSGWIVEVNGHTIHCQNIVSATQTPMLDAFTFFYAKTYPSVSHLAYLPMDHTALDMMINIEAPMQSYHSYDDFLLCGGYAHRCGVTTQEDYDAWLTSIQKTWDCMRPDIVWDTQDLVSHDHLPLIGSLSQTYPNFFIACGFSKWGNTNANVAGKLLSSMILKQEHPLIELFTPNRKTSFLQPKCFQMNIQTAFAFLKSWFPSFADQDCNIQEGKAIELGGHPYGMYRDERNEVYIVDLKCPHMGCVCNFNPVDHTWDCPCHGSRFSYDGSIIKGPTQDHLAPYQEGNNHVDPREFVKKKN